MYSQILHAPEYSMSVTFTYKQKMDFSICNTTQKSNSTDDKSER